MNLVKIVNQYIDTDNSETILQGEDGKYYGLHQELSGFTGYKEIKDTADILNIDQHLDVSPKDTTDGPYLRAYKQYLQDNNLVDDSHTMTETTALDFLLENINADYYEELMLRSA